MSSQLSAHAITAHTAMTRISVSRCSTLPAHRGSASAEKCSTSFSTDIAILPSSIKGEPAQPVSPSEPARPFHALPLGGVSRDQPRRKNVRLMECRDILGGNLEISSTIPIHVCLEKTRAEAQLASLSMSIERGITNPSKRVLPIMTGPNVTIEATQVDVITDAEIRDNVMRFGTRS